MLNFCLSKFRDLQLLACACLEFSLANIGFVSPGILVFLFVPRSFENSWDAALAMLSLNFTLLRHLLRKSNELVQGVDVLLQCFCAPLGTLLPSMRTTWSSPKYVSDYRLAKWHDEGATAACRAVHLLNLLFQTLLKNRGSSLLVLLPASHYLQIKYK